MGGLEQALTKEDIQITNKPSKRFPTSFISREVQVKAMVR
jgi:hypothetical protein